MITAEQANLIFKQLVMSESGVNRLKVMVGGKNFTFSGADDYAAFRFTAKARNKANYMKITLNSNDLYNVEFGYIRAAKYTVRSEINDMYFDSLKEYFEKETGLYLSL